MNCFPSYISTLQGARLLRTGCSQHWPSGSSPPGAGGRMGHSLPTVLLSWRSRCSVRMEGVVKRTLLAEVDRKSVSKNSRTKAGATTTRNLGQSLEEARQKSLHFRECREVSPLRATHNFGTYPTTEMDVTLQLLLPHDSGVYQFGPKSTKYWLLLNYKSQRKAIHFCRNLNPWISFLHAPKNLQFLFNILQVIIHHLWFFSALWDCQPCKDRLLLLYKCIPSAEHGAWPTANDHL